MDDLAGEILRALRELEDWRTGRAAAFGAFAGADQYHPEQSLEHPMTLGAWGRAYATLAALDADPRWAAGLAAANDGLLRTANGTGTFRHACWGLPFGWHGNPPHFPYLITTVLAGDALLAGAEQSGREDWLQGALSAGRWILEENGWLPGPDGARCFHYAPCDVLRIPIHNVNAMAAGFLARLAATPALGAHAAAFGAAADRAVDYLLATQAADGSWRYQEDNPRKGPESHTGYIIEGLALYLLARPTRREHVLRAFTRGLCFYANEQYDGPRALATQRRESLAEARLWAHGWGIGAFALAHRVSGDAGWLTQARAAARWSLDHLRRPDGAFRMFSDDESVYPRNLAHMAYGLAFLLRELGQAAP